ncbi:leucine-rich repeat protein [Perkinsela sp. CCAP 1560/4]|nr:leucine-rich repeat protein [Perkinsela sp. CCAP 1560/4]|eukprot:KNH04877.1 leucine-rich repeat protein [Perkinsela sp. CCAP 1560/4]
MLRMYFSSADFIGRPDRASLPQQALMELLVFGWVNEAAFRDDAGMFHDIIDWTGVECDPDGIATRIDWGSDINLLVQNHKEDTPSGSIDLRWVPSSVTALDLTGLNLTGSIDTFSLPIEMGTLRVSKNALYGAFAIAGHPPSTVRVNVSDNALYGTLSFPDLPRGVELLEFAHNAFTGSIDLSSLPDSLRSLIIGKCLFWQSRSAAPRTGS